MRRSGENLGWSVSLQSALQIRHTVSREGSIVSHVALHLPQALRESVWWLWRTVFLSPVWRWPAIALVR